MDLNDYYISHCPKRRRAAALQSRCAAARLNIWVACEARFGVRYPVKRISPAAVDPALNNDNEPVRGADD